MATIQKRGAGQWRARVRKKGYPVQTKTFAIKSQAEGWARMVESEMDRGKFISMAEAERTTFLEALDRYEREVTPHKKGAKQESFRLRVWRNDPLAHRTLASLRSADFAAWRDARLKDGYSASKIRNDLMLVSHLFNIAVSEWGLEGLQNPISAIRKPSLPEGRDRRLVGDEEKRLMTSCRASRSPWVAPVVVIALETGMRAGEIMSLTWDNVDLDRRIAHLPDTKNNTRRTVPLSSMAVETLKALPRSLTGKVFPAHKATLMENFRRAVTRAKVEDFRFHDLRHEATSRLFEKGLDMMEVATITGHKTLTMLKRYTHLKAENLAEKLR